MNIQLFINDNLVDLNPDEDFKLQKEFQDPEELITKEITYSYDIDLPITDVNSSIFNNSNNIDVANKFNIVYDAQLYCDEILVINGKFIINEIDNENYKGNLYIPAKKELSDILGDRTLAEITPHYVSINNIDDINRINEGVLDGTGDNHICFPYVLYNMPYNNYDNLDGTLITDEKCYQSLNWKECNFGLGNIYPAYNVLSIIKDLFKTEGYEIGGNIFTNSKFLNLYQTYSESPEKYNEIRQTPYYVSFNYNYRIRKNNNTSITATTANIFNNLTVGFDTLLLSDNTSLTNIKNEYNILIENTENSYAMIVPQSGWYQINCRGSISLYNANNKHWNQDGRTRVAGHLGDGNVCNFSASFAELQIMKGASPADNIQPYCVNNGMPCIPLQYDEDETNGTVISDDNYVGMKSNYNQKCLLFGHNNGTTLVKDMSGYSISDFIAGARWGEQIASKNWGTGRDKQCAPERRDMQAATLALPKVGFNPVKSVNDIEYWELYQCSGRQKYESTKTYGSSTAQIMVREDSYSNFEGYNRGMIKDFNEDSTNMIVYSDTVENKSYIGQQNSTAYTNSNTDGNCDIHTCVWLEAGDYVNICLMMPYNSNKWRKHPTMFRHTSWHDKGWGGVVDTGITGFFEMGLINTNKDWRPTSAKPIITNSTELQSDRTTNINECLPNTKCNDYLNSFLQTFNLRLTQTTTNKFSIDLNNQNETIGEIIPIDDYANMYDLTYTRLTLPSTINLRFKIDQTEEGYTNGNTSPYAEDVDKAYNMPLHSGDKTFENPLNTSGTITKKESLWSYNWYKTIFFDDSLNKRKYYIDIPVIAETDIWSGDYDAASAQLESWQTNKTMRFFYINTKKIKELVSNSEDAMKLITVYINIRENGAVHSRIEPKLKLIIPSNFICTYRMIAGKKVEERFMLDYDNSINNIKENDTTMTDKLFNINVKNSYQIDVNCALPNNVYAKIKANSIISLNGGLYNIKEISKHSIMGNSDSTVSLLSL